MGYVVKIYTSYYANSPKIRKKHLAVAISSTLPNWLDTKDWYWFSLLAPEPTILSKYKSGEMDWIEFRRLYLNQLSRYNRQRILNEVIEAALDSKVSTIVFYCYEKDVQYCHRSLLAQYLAPLTGIIQEYKV